jgi:hypothetical protein
VKICAVPLLDNPVDSSTNTPDEPDRFAPIGTVIPPGSINPGREWSGRPEHAALVPRRPRSSTPWATGQPRSVVGRTRGTRAARNRPRVPGANPSSPDPSWRGEFASPPTSRHAGRSHPRSLQSVKHTIFLPCKGLVCFTHPTKTPEFDDPRSCRRRGGTQDDEDRARSMRATARPRFSNSSFRSPARMRGVPHPGPRTPDRR